MAAALLLVAVGAVPPAEAFAELVRLGPGEFTRVGAVTVAATLVAATVSLWAAPALTGSARTGG